MGWIGVERRVRGYVIHGDGKDKQFAQGEEGGGLDYLLGIDRRRRSRCNWEGILFSGLSS